MEGVPVQEVAAIEVNRETLAITDVFHGYAKTDEADSFSRKHIHGLNQDWLELFGQPSEKSLLFLLHHWLDKKSFHKIFANNPQKESQALGVIVYDLKLAPWAERKNHPSHQLAIRYKENSIPICNQSCPKVAHSDFVSAPPSPNPASSLAKAEHGYHCALYDVMELYFEFVNLL